MFSTKFHSPTLSSVCICLWEHVCIRVQTSLLYFFFFTPVQASDLGQIKCEVIVLNIIPLNIYKFDVKWSDKPLDRRYPFFCLQKIQDLGLKCQTPLRLKTWVKEVEGLFYWDLILEPKELGKIFFQTKNFSSLDQKLFSDQTVFFGPKSFRT